MTDLLVNATTGEVVPDCSPEEARSITERIRNAAESLWFLLAEAHQREAWRALKYDSFKDYVEREFGMSKIHAYRLIQQAQVITALTEAAGVTHGLLDLSEREARDLKPHLDEVARKVEEATRDTEPVLKAEAAKAAIEILREEIVAEREEAKEQAKAAPTFVCDTCGDVFDRSVWECAGCKHHLSTELNPDECKYCHLDRTPKKPAITKPDLGDGVSHPARYSKELYPLFVDLLGTFFAGAPASILDPFAGVGGIHRLQDNGYRTVGIELEQEWADLHPDTVRGSALELPFDDETFDAIVTSPTYGNRLADSHNASDPELRRSYTHDLGRTLSPDNSGAMQWGQKYRDFHEQAWAEALRVLTVDGVFLLNIKDHIRAGARQHVSGWHVTTLCRMGLSLLEHHDVSTGNLRQGANASLRFNEQVYVFVKDPK